MNKKNKEKVGYLIDKRAKSRDHYFDFHEIHGKKRKICAKALDDVFIGEVETVNNILNSRNRTSEEKIYLDFFLAHLRIVHHDVLLKIIDVHLN